MYEETRMTEKIISFCCS